ncbi:MULTISPECIES: hypothetical protein [Caballeronia]|uniref:hypothetical protein n=2 Tax=Caballeronia TaxID=1827195 RepID=UPI00158B1B43|nr:MULTISPECIES: hypothetical protein [Caballeronia]MCG7404525.1 hypothetical protein [Caballeronia zhejiangensis]MDR5764390.1 hypothetical protein [Caballeronia sp. LZ028]
MEGVGGKMLNFVLGFFREYWPVVLAYAIARFVVPPVVGWIYRKTAGDEPRVEVERGSGNVQTQIAAKPGEMPK